MEVGCIKENGEKVRIVKIRKKKEQNHESGEGKGVDEGVKTRPPGVGIRDGPKP